jgi:hypothetical protein
MCACRWGREPAALVAFLSVARSTPWRYLPSTSRPAVNRFAFLSRFFRCALPSTWPFSLFGLLYLVHLGFFASLLLFSSCSPQSGNDLTYLCRSESIRLHHAILSAIARKLRSSPIHPRRHSRTYPRPLCNSHAVSHRLGLSPCLQNLVVWTLRCPPPADCPPWPQQRSEWME